MREESGEGVTNEDVTSGRFHRDVPGWVFAMYQMSRHKRVFEASSRETHYPRDNSVQEYIHSRKKASKWMIKGLRFTYDNVLYISFVFVVWTFNLFFNYEMWDKFIYFTSAYQLFVRYVLIENLTSLHNVRVKSSNVTNAIQITIQTIRQPFRGSVFGTVSISGI
jgi:hypothetical protein